MTFEKAKEIRTQLRQVEINNYDGKLIEGHKVTIVENTHNINKPYYTLTIDGQTTTRRCTIKTALVKAFEWFDRQGN